MLFHFQFFVQPLDLGCEIGDQIFAFALLHLIGFCEWSSVTVRFMVVVASCGGGGGGGDVIVAIRCEVGRDIFAGSE